MTSSSKPKPDAAPTPLSAEQLKSVVGGGSFVFASPELVVAAAPNLRGIHDAGALSAQLEAVHGSPTASVTPAATDEVSTATAALFGAHAQQYQSLSGQAAALHEQFAQTLAAAPQAPAGTTDPKPDK